MKSCKFLFFLFLFSGLNAQIDSLYLYPDKVTWPDGRIRFEGTMYKDAFWTGTEYSGDAYNFVADTWKNGIRSKVLDAHRDSLALLFLNENICDTCGNYDLARFGFLIVISEPHAFPFRFELQNKSFNFDQPPYHELHFLFGKRKKLALNKGRKLYFVHSNFSNSGHYLPPDTLTFEFYDYVLSGEKEADRNYRKDKTLRATARYVIDPKRRGWVRIPD